MRILALVTARGGSKRLPGKNIRLLQGRPLITWSIDVVKDIPGVCDVLVSTDDPAIAEVAREAGALVPWLRPAELATDYATSVDVCLHALDWYQGIHGAVDGLLLLQPTSPFRSKATVLQGLALFSQYEMRTVIGLSAAVSHPMLCYRIEKDVMSPFVKADLNGVRTQDLPPAYIVNGAFYLISPSNLQLRRSFYSDDTVPLVIEDQRESIDIDTELDWIIAQSLLLADENKS